MENTKERDAVWEAFRQRMRGYQPTQQEIIDQKWHDMAQQSTQKRLMLQKQNNLLARHRAL